MNRSNAGTMACAAFAFVLLAAPNSALAQGQQQGQQQGGQQAQPQGGQQAQPQLPPKLQEALNKAVQDQKAAQDKVNRLQDDFDAKDAAYKIAQQVGNPTTTLPALKAAADSAAAALEKPKQQLQKADKWVNDLRTAKPHQYEWLEKVANLKAAGEEFLAANKKLEEMQANPNTAPADLKAQQDKARALTQQWFRAITAEGTAYNKMVEAGEPSNVQPPQLPPAEVFPRPDERPPARDPLQEAGRTGGEPRQALCLLLGEAACQAISLTVSVPVATDSQVSCTYGKGGADPTMVFPSDSFGNPSPVINIDDNPRGGQQQPASAPMPPELKEALDRAKQEQKALQEKLPSLKDAYETAKGLVEHAKQSGGREQEKRAYESLAIESNSFHLAEEKLKDLSRWIEAVEKADKPAQYDLLLSAAKFMEQDSRYRAEVEKTQRMKLAGKASAAEIAEQEAKTAEEGRWFLRAMDFYRELWDYQKARGVEISPFLDPDHSRRPPEPAAGPGQMPQQPAPPQKQAQPGEKPGDKTDKATPDQSGLVPRSTPTIPIATTDGVTLHVKATQTAQQGDTPATELKGETLKLVALQKPDLPKTGASKPAGDIGHDRSPVTCTTGADGTCKAHVPAEERATYGFPTDGPAHYAANLNPARPTGAVIEKAAGPADAALAKDASAGTGATVAKSDFRIGDKTFTRIGVQAAEQIAAAVMAKTGKAFGKRFEVDICRDKQPGPPLGMEPLNFSAVGNELPATMIKLRAGGKR